MPWMRIAIGMGCAGLLAGAAGMSLWIEDGSHYFDLAVALASAGLLTLVSCVLTRVFGSSHGSQDDAFQRGRSMGYDAGFLEGHRTARPVVVPLHAVAQDVHDEEDQSNAVTRIDGLNTSQAKDPFWERHATRDARDRAAAWVAARRIPLLAGALCLALVGVVFTSAALRKPVPAGTLNLAHGPLFYRAAPASGAIPAMVSKRAASPARVAVTGASPAAPAAGTVAVPVSAPGGVIVAAPASSRFPAVASGGSAPRPAPVAAAPAVPLTAAQQTAADAAAAAALTAANAKAAADLTAANAAAAAEATRRQAAADAWAVAHPKP